jgi:hypothetical protein
MLIPKVSSTLAAPCGYAKNIDPGPYRRMQKKGWLTGQPVGKREAVYEITDAGRAIIADLPDAS